MAPVSAHQDGPDQTAPHVSPCVLQSSFFIKRRRFHIAHIFGELKIRFFLLTVSIISTLISQLFHLEEPVSRFPGSDVGTHSLLKICF